ncbi:hypothetical protein BKA81DRAFT_382602 [Phyllosticta paracitricarpa]
MSSTASERKGSGEDTQDQLVVKLYYNRKNAHKLKLNTPTGQNQNPEMPAATNNMQAAVLQLHQPKNSGSPWRVQLTKLTEEMAKLEQDNTNLKQSNADLKRSNVDSKRSNAKIHEKHRRVQASEGALRKQMADMESTKEKQNTDNINHMQDVKRSLKRKFEEWVDDAMQPPHRRLKDDPYAL